MNENKSTNQIDLICKQQKRLKGQTVTGTYKDTTTKKNSKINRLKDANYYYSQKYVAKRLKGANYYRYRDTMVLDRSEDR